MVTEHRISLSYNFGEPYDQIMADKIKILHRCGIHQASKVPYQYQRGMFKKLQAYITSENDTIFAKKLKITCVRLFDDMVIDDVLECALQLFLKTDNSLHTTACCLFIYLMGLTKLMLKLNHR